MTKSMLARLTVVGAVLALLIVTLFTWGDRAMAMIGALHGLPAASASPLTAPVVIPFELRGDYAIMKVEVNGTPTLLILDTGSGASALDTEFARVAKVESTGQQAQVQGSKTSTASLARARTVSLGPVTLSNVIVVPVSLESVRSAIGHDVHGTLGYDLFANYTVAIDYSAQTMTLYDPKDFTYSGTGAIVPITVQQRLPMVNASISTRKSGPINARLILDLGSASYALRLGAPFVAAHDLTHDTSTIAGVFGIGVGGITEGRLLRLPQLTLGNFVVYRPSTALGDKAEGAFGQLALTDGTVGVPAWRGARVIVDYARSRVIVESRQPPNTADSVDASGLTVVEEEQPTRALRVIYVVAGSAGADAGVQTGDELLQIDNKPASSITVQGARDLLHAAGVTRQLVLRRGAQTVNASIKLRMLF